MDEVTKNLVTAQLKEAKSSEMLHDALVSAMIAANYAVDKARSNLSDAT